MVEDSHWQEWRRKELESLGELIAWTPIVFNSTEVKIEKSKLYGTALLAHSIESARAIRLCIAQNLSGPAFALARTQYEAALRGHIVVHEINSRELDEWLERIERWFQGKKSSRQSPPKIELRGAKWRCVAPKDQSNAYVGKWCTIMCENAGSWQRSVVDIGSLHDLTHSGITQALQMLNEHGEIGSFYSIMNQTLLLYFAQRTTMFVIMTWPGAMQKYSNEIERRAQTTLDRVSAWQPYVQGTKC